MKRRPEACEVVVQYECQHISCRNPKCYKAKLELSKATYELLYSNEPEVGFMRSPTGHCPLGNVQKFRVVSQQLAGVDSVNDKDRLAALQLKSIAKRKEIEALKDIYQKQRDTMVTDLKGIDADILRLQAKIKSEA